MTAPDVEREIDTLYKLPLDQFTPARNALARKLSGEAAAHVKALAKPSVPAWVVNQLYWRARPVWDRLVKAAERLRSAHRSALSGRSADLRGVEDAHRKALADAVSRAAALLEETGRGATEATRRAVAQTLEALPVDAPPGRLLEPASPPGFALLAGLPPKTAAPKLRAVPAGRKPQAPARAGAATAEEARRAAERDRQAKLAEAKKVQQQAERDARRAADAHAAADRELARLKAAEESAREAWERAQKAVVDRVRDVSRLEHDAQVARFALRDAERRLKDLTRR